MILPPITIPEPWNLRYRKARAVLYGAAFAFALAAIFRIIFPSQTLLFDFTKPGSLANLLSAPRDTTGVPLTDGKIGAKTLLFNAGIIGNYSSVLVVLTPHPKSTPVTGGALSVRRSYASFLLPTNPSPALFPAGTLLSNTSRYAIIDDDGKRIMFTDDRQWTSLGYQSGSFLAVNDEEFARNPDGGTWTNDTDHPSGTVFLIGDDFYELRNDTLHRFVSEGAYLSLHDMAEAIPRDPSFLERFEENDEWIGFRTGTLLQYADGIFFVDGATVQPIGSPEIFTALGFDWNRVIKASAEEMSLYKRGKIALLNAPQPNGTVFHDIDTGEYFVVSGSEKRPIESNALLHLLTKNLSPIDVSSRALETVGHCALKQSIWSDQWSCTIPVTEFAALPGNNYEFSVVPSADSDGIQLANIETTFHSTMEISSLRSALSQIRQQIIDRYAK